MKLKKLMAVALSAVLVCSFSITAFASPSPSIVEGSSNSSDEESTSTVVPSAQPSAAEDQTGAVVTANPVNVVISDQEVTVPGSTNASTLQQDVTVNSEKAATLAGTIFRNALNQIVDASLVKLVITPATIAQTQDITNELAAAIGSVKARVYNSTGKKSISLVDSLGNLNVVKCVYVSLQDQKGNILSHNGAIAPAFVQNDVLGYENLDRGKNIQGLYQGTVRSWDQNAVLGNTRLKAGETVQALVQRADKSWVAVPVVMSNGVIAISLPAFSNTAKVVFVIVKGESLADIPAQVAKSPNT